MAAVYVNDLARPHLVGVLVRAEKGRGIVTLTKREKGDFLLNYKGEHIHGREGDTREENDSTGFRFFYKSNGKTLMGFLVCAMQNNPEIHLLKDGESFDIGNYKFKWKNQDADLSSDDSCDSDDDTMQNREYVTEVVCPGPSSKPPEINGPSSEPPEGDVSTKGKKQATKIQRLSEEQSQLLRKLFQTNIYTRPELKMIDFINVIKKYECLKELFLEENKKTQFTIGS